jgi:hypothetical protein
VKTWNNNKTKEDYKSVREGINITITAQSKVVRAAPAGSFGGKFATGCSCERTWAGLPLPTVGGLEKKKKVSHNIIDIKTTLLRENITYC